MIVWPIELVAVLLLAPGMLSVLNGSVDDGYGGLLGWMWAVSAITTIALLGVTWLALRERYYSAVMAATGLLYLAILTAFGMDLVARAPPRAVTRRGRAIPTSSDRIRAEQRPSHDNPTRLDR